MAYNVVVLVYHKVVYEETINSFGKMPTSPRFIFIDRGSEDVGHNYRLADVLSREDALIL